MELIGPMAVAKRGAHDFLLRSSGPSQLHSVNCPDRARTVILDDSEAVPESRLLMWK